jgi:hypothetical protein
MHYCSNQSFFSSIGSSLDFATGINFNEVKVTYLAVAFFKDQVIFPSELTYFYHLLSKFMAKK